MLGHKDHSVSVASGQTPFSDTHLIWTERLPQKSYFVHDWSTLLISSELFAFFLPSQPDLLNFKKGWLTKQYEDGQVSA